MKLKAVCKVPDVELVPATKDKNELSAKMPFFKLFPLSF